MPPKKRLKYNWKARKSEPAKNLSRGIGREEKDKPDIAETTVYGVTSNSVRDTNAPILPTKDKTVESKDEKCVIKKKRLSSKQRKRLQKIVLAKEQRKQVCTLFSAHPTWSPHWLKNPPSTMHKLCSDIFI